MVLREARPPRSPRRWAFYAAAALFGLGLGNIVFFGRLFLGTGLILVAGFLYTYAREDPHAR